MSMAGSGWLLVKGGTTQNWVVLVTFHGCVTGTVVLESLARPGTGTVDREG